MIGTINITGGGSRAQTMLVRLYEHQQFSPVQVDGRTVYIADDAGELLIEDYYPVTSGECVGMFSWPYKWDEMLLDDGRPARIFTAYTVDAERREQFMFTLFFEPDSESLTPKSLAYRLKKKETVNHGSPTI